MNVLIAGGTGLIGRALIAELHKDGHAVVVLSRNPHARAEKMPGVSLVAWDGKTPRGWAHLLEEMDAVVNLTGENIAGEHFFPRRWSRLRKQAIRSSRIDPARAMVEAIRLAKKKPAVLVQSSGISIYGPSRGEIITEDDAAGKDYFSRLAVDWENASLPVETLGVRRVIIRSAVVLSAVEGAVPRLMLPIRLYAGGPMGSGRQYLPWIHPADEAAAISFLIRNRKAHGAYNLVAPHSVTNAQFGRTLAHLLKRPYWLPVPAFAMRLAFGEVSDVVLTGQRAVPARLQEAGFKFQFPELEPALRDMLAQLPGN